METQTRLSSPFLGTGPAPGQMCSQYFKPIPGTSSHSEDSTTLDGSRRSSGTSGPSPQQASGAHSSSSAGYWKVDAAPFRMPDDEDLHRGFSFGQAPPRTSRPDNSKPAQEAPRTHGGANRMFGSKTRVSALHVSSESDQTAARPSAYRAGEADGQHQLAAGHGLPSSIESSKGMNELKTADEGGRECVSPLPKRKAVKDFFESPRPSRTPVKLHQAPGSSPSKGLGELPAPQMSLAALLHSGTSQQDDLPPYPMSVRSFTTHSVPNTPTPLGKPTSSHTRAVAPISRPSRETPSSPQERRGPLGDLEPPRRIVKTPRHPKSGAVASRPSRDMMPSRASNVSKKRSHQPVRASSPERHKMAAGDAISRLSPERPGYLHQGVANVQNFGTYWNGFISDLLQQMETADGELKQQRQQLTQFEDQVQELETQNADLRHALEKEDTEKRRIQDQNEKLLETTQQQECQISELQAEKDEKMAKLHALSKKFKDRLNAVIKDGHDSYAAGKDRWSGAIMEAKATSNAVSALKASLDQEAAKFQTLNRMLEDMSKDIEVRGGQHQEAIHRLDEEKQGLHEQMQQLRVELQLSQEENERLREHSRKREHDYSQQLGGSLKRLEDQTADLARKLDGASVEGFQAQIAERLDTAIAELTKATLDARMGEQRLEVAVASALEQRNSNILSEMRAILNECPGRDDLDKILDTALESQAQAVDNCIVSTLDKLTGQWVTSMSQKLQETAGKIGEMSKNLEGLNEIKTVASSLDRVRAVVEEIGQHESATSAVVKALGDQLQAQGERMNAVGHQLEERFAGQLEQHFGKQDDRLEGRLSEGHSRLEEYLKQQDGRLEGCLRQQETQLGALAEQLGGLQAAAPASEQQIASLQHDLEGAQQRISNLMHRLRNSGFSSATSQKIGQELGTIHAETETIRSRITGNRADDLAGDDEVDGSDEDDDDTTTEDDTRGCPPLTQGSSSRRSASRSLTAEPLDRKVVVRSPGSDRGGVLSHRAPHNDLSQQPRSIMKMVATQSQVKISDLKISDNQETASISVIPVLAGDLAHVERSANQNIRDSTGSRGDAAASSVQAQGEFFPLGHDDSTFRQFLVPFSQSGSRNLVTAMQPKEALARGLINPGSQRVLGQLPRAFGVQGAKRGGEVRHWFEPSSKRRRSETVPLGGSQSSAKEVGGGMTVQASHVARVVGGTLDNSQPAKSPKGRIVRTYSRKEGSNPESTPEPTPRESDMQRSVKDGQLNPHFRRSVQRSE